MLAASVRQMSQIDEYAIQTLRIPSTLLMDRAARAAAEEAEALLRGAGGKKVCVFCGTGKNGGDGLAAARRLHMRGAEVAAWIVGNVDKAHPDSLEMKRRLEEVGVTPVAYQEQGAPPDLCGCDLIIDAIFGTGFHGALEGPAQAAARLINRSGVPVLSVDMPSGVSGDTGAADSDTVRAVKTVTFTLPKIGQLLMPGDGPLGALKVCDIGIPSEAIERLAITVESVDREMIRKLLHVRRSDSHKGDYGKIFALCGSRGYAGAARFATHAAVKTGSGLVTLGVPESIYALAARQAGEVMTHPLPETDAGTVGLSSIPDVLQLLDRSVVLLMGCGLGRAEETRQTVRRLIESARLPIVLDADGINAIAGNIDVLSGAKNIVLTPHEVEFARIGGDIAAADRIGAARAFAVRHRCVLVRKGHRTIVASPDGRVCVNTTGNPGMAKGGSGDILAGMIASLIGQGLAAFDAAVCAVYLHGCAGDLCAKRLGEYGMTPGDMLDAIPAAIKEQFSEV